MKNPEFDKNAGKHEIQYFIVLVLYFPFFGKKHQVYLYKLKLSLQFKEFVLPCVFSRLFGGGAGPGRHAPPRVVHGFTLHIVLRLRSGTNPQNTHHSSFYALAAQPAPTMPDGCAIFLPQEKNAFFARESGVRVGQSRRQDTLVISSSTSQAHRT